MSTVLPLIDRATLYRLTLDVGEENAIMLLGSLKAEILASQKKLEKYLALQEWALFENQAHALKSASRSFGAMQLGEACMVLEQAAKEARYAYLKTEVVKFNGIVTATLTEYSSLEK